MRSSYRTEDVTILLKDITGLVEPQPAEQREKNIQAGVHYCEMLPLEYSPSAIYMQAYQAALAEYARPTAEAIALLAEQILQEKGPDVVLVSLARAGIPAGILVKRYLQRRYGLSVDHYAISIIRGRGIDKNAMKYLLQQYSPEQLQFIDGWTGKGVILRELKQDLQAFPGVSDRLAVIADPAAITDLCGTYSDLLIPNSCLNSTVSGLISRTFLREDMIGPQDFHGAVYYKELEQEDVSYAFIEAIESCFPAQVTVQKPKKPAQTGFSQVQEIAAAYGISDMNLIKPGIGETTRVLLRRVPWKVLIRKDAQQSAMIQHILRLAEEKHVPVEYYPLRNYKTCGLIRSCSDV